MSQSAFDPGTLVGGGGGQRYYRDIKLDHGAVGDGTTDDGAHFMDFNAYGRAQTTGVRLVIPAATYHFASSFGANGPGFTVGVKDLVIDAYGATLDKLYLGTGFYQDDQHSGLIQSASAGATTLTLVNLSDAARFIVGNWICIMHYDMQGGGSFPPNPLQFEYRYVTAIDLGTGIITVDRKILNSYSSTLPSYGEGSGFSMPSCGPARIYMMQPDWDRRLVVKGLTVTQATDIFGTCRSLHFIDCTFTCLPDSTAGTDITFTNCKAVVLTTTVMEIDKLINNLSLDNLDSKILKIQSASVEKFELRNSRVTQIQGTAKHNVLDNCDIEKLQLGTLSFGTTYSMVIRNCRVQDFASTGGLSHFVPSTSLSNGRFTLSKFQYAGFGTGPTDNNWILNSVYFVNDCLPFRITNVTDNGAANVTVTDGIFNSDNTVSTASSGPFLVGDVGLYLKNTSGIQNNTKVATFIDANHITVDKPTTATGTGKTVTINRAMIFVDTTLPATVNLTTVTGTGVYAGIAGYNIKPHPCLDITVHGCAGSDQPRNLKNLNRAPSSIPYGSYALYRCIGGSYSAFNPSEMWGYITKVRVNVRRAYTGTRPTLFVGFGQFGIVGFATENSSGATIKYNPCVDTKTVGERIITPGNTIGTAGADTLLALTTFWISNSMFAPLLKTTTTGAQTDLTAENQTVWPIIDVEVFTDQGPVVSAAV